LNDFLGWTDEAMSEHHPTNVPGNYQEVLYWKITQNKTRLILMNLLGIVLFVPACLLFSSWSAFLHRDLFQSTSLRGSIGGLLIAMIIALILHELFHGAAIFIFGGRPQFGIIWQKLLFYATAPGYAFQRNQYLVVALAPLIAGSILAMIVIALPIAGSLVWLLVIGATINAAGAIGDLWIAAIVLRYPAQAYVVDERDGMRIFMPS
jgi:hypothetical protein